MRSRSCEQFYIYIQASGDRSFSYNVYFTMDGKISLGCFVLILFSLTNCDAFQSGLKAIASQKGLDYGKRWKMCESVFVCINVPCLCLFFKLLFTFFLAGKEAVRVVAQRVSYLRIPNQSGSEGKVYYWLTGWEYINIAMISRNNIYSNSILSTNKIRS